MSDAIKTIYAPEHARMLKALTDDKAVVVYHRSGPTWNDGGAWHRIVARLTDGTHVSIKMESDYAPDVLIVEPLKQWPPMDDKDAELTRLRAREYKLAALLNRAREELYMIRMKDSGAVYDVTLRMELADALSAYEEALE